MSLLGIAVLLSNFAFAAKPCECKCVTKDNGKISLTYGKGKDRETAGENLKKNLLDKKCELSPVCEGDCAIK